MAGSSGASRSPPGRWGDCFCLDLQTERRCVSASSFGLLANLIALLRRSAKTEYEAPPAGPDEPEAKVTSLTFQMDNTDRLKRARSMFQALLSHLSNNWACPSLRTNNSQVYTHIQPQKLHTKHAPLRTVPITKPGLFLAFNSPDKQTFL